MCYLVICPVTSLPASQKVNVRLLHALTGCMHWLSPSPWYCWWEGKTRQDDFQQTGQVSFNKDWQQLSRSLMHALSTVHQWSPQIVYHDKSSPCTLCRNTGGPLMWRHQGCSLPHYHGCLRREKRETRACLPLLSSWRSVNKISRLWDDPETISFSKCAVHCTPQESQVGCRTCFNTSAFWAWALMRLFFFSSLQLAPHQTPPHVPEKVLSVIWLHFLPL